MHYYGMRTRHCRKLRENTICNEVQTIFILKTGTVYLGPYLEEKEAKHLLKEAQHSPLHLPREVEILNSAQKDALAWKDGFRVAGSTLNNPAGCFELMYRWWSQTHSLPFVGQLIKW